MGQEQSSQQIDPNDPPQKLKSRTLEAVAEYIKDEGRHGMRIVLMTGAGISTSAGIPDFRSPDTGLYANLARLDLPHAEAVFDISYFREHPEPFYVLARELHPGRFQPTVAHAFIALLDKKGLLEMLFTQNIDCLERRAGVPGNKIVEAHGSFATQSCIECGTEYPSDLMLKAVHSAEVPHCIVPECNGLVKPDIVFFGESLPDAFFQNRHVPTTADLIIVLGTSLTVYPFAGLPQIVPEGVPRVLINKERVGDFGSRLDDVIIEDECDAGVRRLADALGWRDELEALWYDVSGKHKEKEAEEADAKKAAMSKDEVLEAEIEKLTSEVDAVLKLGKDTSLAAKDLPKEPMKEEHPVAISNAQVPVAEGTVSHENLNASLRAGNEETILGRTSSGTNDAAVSHPVNTEKLAVEDPKTSTTVDKEAILDLTMPQHERHNDPSDDQKPGSHI